MKRVVLGVALAGMAAGVQAGAQKVCDVKAYGAKGDGVTLDTAAIQKAVDDCAGKGGGVVRLAGAAMYVSAPVVLKSHITLEVAEGTTLAGSENHEDYPAIEEFGEPRGRQSLLSAQGAEDITIRGGGVIDGRGASWWVKPSEPRPRLIVFDHCKHVRMENVTVENSPMWQIVPYYSEDVTFRNMKILAPTPAGHNTDGIDPFSSKKVVIDHVYIDTGDDNVAIKSGQPGSKGGDEASTDITITDCVFMKGHGLSVGSEVAGGVQRLRVERVTFKGTTQGIRIKSGRDRGNDVGDFFYKDIVMEGVRIPIQITEYYGAPRGTDPVNVATADVTRLTPHFHDIRIENLKATGAQVVMEIAGLPEAPIQGVRLKNVQIEAAKGGRIAYADVVSEGLLVKAESGEPLTTGPGAKGSLK